MVDLHEQYLHIKSEVDEAIARVLNSTKFIRGPEVTNFEANLQSYLGVKHVCACANGTDALQIALMALDLEPGDEVLTPSFSFIAAAEVIALLGLKPVLVDVDPNTFNIDFKDLESKIGPNTKVILPVHLFGQCSDMERIMVLAYENDLFVIEDNAQAIGADFIFRDGLKVKAGAIGHIGTTSFFPSKNLGCYGDGGALFTNNEPLAKRIKMITNHGSSEKYYHKVIGVNSRLDAMQAAVLNVKLKHLDGYNLARNKVADFYDSELKGLDGIHTPKRSENSEHVFHQYTLRVEKDRDEMQEYLKGKGIPSMVYYPVPIHSQEAYLPYLDENEHFPNAEKLAQEVLSLPMSTELDSEQLNYIVGAVLEFVKSKQIVEIK
jgi:UDP-2-acetamido-2-deoxy-ribo-hexuluronate aminotransferase